MDIFSQAPLRSLSASISNHTPLLLNINHKQGARFHRRFHFENAWLVEKGLEEVIHRGWSNMGLLMMFY